MRLMILAGLLGLATLVGGTVPQAEAQRRSYYSAKYKRSGYTYRQYRYYSKAYGENRYHMAIYHPSRPRYVYYYNPYSKPAGKYWGRCDLKTGGYSMLADRDKKPTLAEIPESAFPKPGRFPPPEPGGEEEMLPPPEACMK